MNAVYVFFQLAAFCACVFCLTMAVLYFIRLIRGKRNP